MNQKDAQILIDTIKGLVGGEPTRETVATGPNHKLVRPVPAGTQMLNPVGIKDFDGAQALVDAILRNSHLVKKLAEALFPLMQVGIIDACRIDPLLIELVQSRPEIERSVEVRKIQLDGSSLKGRIAGLMASGFYAGPKTQGATRAELRRTGGDVNSGSLSTAMNDYVKEGFFTREGDGYTLAPDIKITDREVATR